MHIHAGRGGAGRGGARAPDGAACTWLAAAERLLSPLTSLAQQAQPPGSGDSDSAFSPVVLHYALMAFCKLWLLRPSRPSREALLLLSGAWRAIANHEYPATPLRLPPEGCALFAADGAGGIFTSVRGKGDERAPLAGRRL